MCTGVWHVRWSTHLELVSTVVYLKELCRTDKDYIRGDVTITLL